MPAKGRDYHFTPNSLADEAEVSTAQRMAKNSAIQSVMTMLMGDPNWLGAKRGAFRMGELCAIPTDPESMDLEFTTGSALLNDGSDHQGNWYLIYGTGKTVTIEASSHPTLDRYDIVCFAPKRVATGAVAREVVDGQGNVSTVNDHPEWYDDFDIVVVKGENGAAAPDVSRLDAYTLVAPGLVPVSIVRVQGGATEISLADLQDVREVLTIRTFPVNQSTDANVITLLGGILAPQSPGTPAIVVDAGAEANIPTDMFFVDKQGGSPGVLKYKFDDDTIVTIADPGA